MPTRCDGWLLLSARSLLSRRRRPSVRHQVPTAGRARSGPRAPSVPRIPHLPCPGAPHPRRALATWPSAQASRWRHDPKPHFLPVLRFVPLVPLGLGLGQAGAVRTCHALSCTCLPALDNGLASQGNGAAGTHRMLELHTALPTYLGTYSCTTAALHHWVLHAIPGSCGWSPVGGLTT